jgi:hypothetical protein
MKKLLVCVLSISLFSACNKALKEQKVGIDGQVLNNNIGQKASVFILRKNSNVFNSRVTKNSIVSTNATGNYSDSLLSEIGDAFYALALPADTNLDISFATLLTNMSSKFTGTINLSKSHRATIKFTKVSSDNISGLTLKRVHQDPSLNPLNDVFDMNKEAIFIARYHYPITSIFTDSVKQDILWSAGTHKIIYTYTKNGSLIEKSDTIRIAADTIATKEIAL